MYFFIVLLFCLPHRPYSGTWRHHMALGISHAPSCMGFTVFSISFQIVQNVVLSRASFTPAIFVGRIIEWMHFELIGNNAFSKYVFILCLGLQDLHPLAPKALIHQENLSLPLFLPRAHALSLIHTHAQRERFSMYWFIAQMAMISWVKLADWNSIPGS